MGLEVTEAVNAGGGDGPSPVSTAGGRVDDGEGSSRTDVLIADNSSSGGASFRASRLDVSASIVDDA
ncbi:MAG: hypothetical protein ABW185_00460 [Sedimenticola sp.]